MTFGNGTGCNTGPISNSSLDMRKAFRKVDMANLWWLTVLSASQYCVIGVFLICPNFMYSPGTEWELWVGHFNCLHHLFLSVYIFQGVSRWVPWALWLWDLEVVATEGHWDETWGMWVMTHSFAYFSFWVCFRLDVPAEFTNCTAFCLKRLSSCCFYRHNVKWFYGKNCSLCIFILSILSPNLLFIPIELC